MTGTSAAALRTFAFGDLEASLWGAAWFGGMEFVSLGHGTETVQTTATLAGADQAEDWRLFGDAVELSISGAGTPVATSAPDARIEGFEQLCQVRGRFTLGGAEHAVDCPGLRGARRGELELDRFESTRRVSVWFDSEEGLALLALRPPGSRGHDADVVTAAVLDVNGGRAVADPRLSTTYGPSGHPARAALELWLAEEPAEGEPEQPYPRRAAGEALDTRAASLVGDLAVEADLLRWHSRGRTGAGVYLLARR